MDTVFEHGFEGVYPRHHSGVEVARLAGVCNWDEVSRGDKVALRGTDPESYTTEYTSVYEDTSHARNPPSGRFCRVLIRNGEVAAYGGIESIPKV